MVTVTDRSEIRPAKDPEDFRQCSTLELPANHPVNTAPSGHTSDAVAVAAQLCRPTVITP